MKNYINEYVNAASDGIYYIKVTGLAAEDLKSVGWNKPSPLRRILEQYYGYKRQVALKLDAISDLTDMSYCFYGCSCLVQGPEIPNGVQDHICPR